MRQIRAAVVAALVVVGAAACGAGGGGTTRVDAPVATSVAGPADVVQTSCEATARPGSQPVGSCTFVLSDGERFRCAYIAGASPSAPMLERDKRCVRMSTLVIPPAVRGVAVKIADDRACLTARGLPARGGPVLVPSASPGARGPAGELVVGRVSSGFRAGHPPSGAAMAYYTDAEKAQRGEPLLLLRAQRLRAQLERHGAITILWFRPPTNALRAAVQACVLG